MITVSDVTYAYGNGGFRLSIPSFTAQKGERIAVVGPSGSGKTTLLNLIAGITTPDAGRVEVDGVDVGAASDAARRAFRARTIGFVFQNFALMDYLTGMENILYPFRVSPALTLDQAARERAQALADACGIGAKLNRHPAALSQGEQQRVAICRALSTRPKLILADEATGNLDPAAKASILDVLFARAAEAEATVNVFVEGPVARIEITHLNPTGNTLHRINVTDVYFSTTDSEVGAADVIDGGAGDDLIDAGEGDDTITLAEDDTVTGGDGADTFVITDQDASGIVITDFDTATGIDGGQDPADQADNDFADLSGFFATLEQMRDANTAGPGADVVLDLGGGQTLTFEGVTDVNELTFENTNVVCFARGTMIRTPCGETRIEDLDVGDRVITRDHRRQRIRWHGVRTVEAEGDMAPIVLKTGAVGNRRDLLVSPLHRILLTGMRAMVHCGAPEVLVAAKHLINDDTIYRCEGGEVEYHHILFDEHEIIYANGAAAESLHPGKDNLDGFGAESREELLKIFPELRGDPMSYGPSARPSVRSFEARVLAN